MRSKGGRKCTETWNFVNQIHKGKNRMVFETIPVRYKKIIIIKSFSLKIKMKVKKNKKTLLSWMKTSL